MRVVRVCQCVGWRVELPALGDQGVVALAEGGQPAARQSGGSVTSGPFDGDVQFDEQLSERGGPGLSGELGHPGQFPQVVGVAQAVKGSAVLAIDHQAVVDRDSAEAREDPPGVHRDPAPVVLRWNSVQVSVQATWIQCNFPATRPPVSSKCATRAAASCSRAIAKNPSRRAAAFDSSNDSHPVETAAPNASSRHSAARSTGRC